MTVVDGRKRCSRCNTEKSTGDFYKSSSSKDGFQGYCKLCVAEKNKESYYANHEERKTYLRQRRVDSPEEWREYGRDYYSANRDRILQVRSASWYRHREKNCEKGRRYKATNRQVVKRSEQARAARLKGATIIPFTQDQLRSRWEYYGGKCWICRGTAIEDDHVKPLSKGGAHMLCNLRPICRKCNGRKSAKWPLSLVILERIAA